MAKNIESLTKKLGATVVSPVSFSSKRPQATSRLPGLGNKSAGTDAVAYDRWFTAWRCLEEIGSDPESGSSGLTFSEV